VRFRLGEYPSGVRISTVVPVFNEEDSLPELHRRLAAALDSADMEFEAIYVDDGSRDGSVRVLRDLADRDPRIVVVILNRNYGQHAAVFAGMAESRGETVVTLDADLQNPPEEVPAVVRRAEEGVDVVATYRPGRRDSLFRRWASSAINFYTSRATGISLKDYDCMLRGYRRPVVDALLSAPEISTFIPALANTFARSIAEIPVAHAERSHGNSRYSLRRLISLQFDLMTGFSTFPIRLMTWVGILISSCSFLLGGYLLLRRFVWGIEEEFGLFTLAAFGFLAIGALFVSIGVLGEYVARIYAEVRHRPRFIVSAVLREPGRGASGRPHPAPGDRSREVPCASS
jgi:undecaprenyl-phosphate 4-deoxy-4-formamido-L-arabinose transferase